MHKNAYGNPGNFLELRGNYGAARKSRKFPRITGPPGNPGNSPKLRGRPEIPEIPLNYGAARKSRKFPQGGPTVKEFIRGKSVHNVSYSSTEPHQFN